MATSAVASSTRKDSRSRGLLFVNHAALLLLGLLSVATLSASSKVAPLDQRLRREEAQRIVDLTNAERLRHSLNVLSVNGRLALAAERYSEVMARQDWLDHRGPDGSTVDGRAEAAGYLDWAYLGENLAAGAGPPPPGAIVDGWMNSPAHRDNLLSPHLQEIGVGCYVRAGPDQHFWCAQELGTRGR